MLRLFSTVFLLMLIFSTYARAGVFKVAMVEIPPFTLKQGKEPRGILVDVVRQAAQRAGHEVEFSFYPWPRAVQYVKMGKSDAIMPFFKNDERQKFARFPEESILEMKLALFGKKGSGIRIEELKYAVPYSLIKVNKANLGQTFTEYMQRNILFVEKAPNTESALRQLMADRVQVFASVKTIAEFGASNYGFSSEIEQVSPIFDELDCFIAFSLASDKLIISGDITEEIAKMKKAGEINEIIASYMQIPEPSRSQ